MLSVLVDNSVIKTRADRPSDKERIEKPIEMYSFLEKAETDSKNSDIEPLYDGPKYVQRKSNIRCLLTGICLAIVIIGVVASLALLGYKLSTLGHGREDTEDTFVQQLKVQTTTGYVTGVVEEGVHVFKGIPYAVPPVGKYRWKAPVALDETQEGDSSPTATTVFAAENFPPKCFQYEVYYSEGNMGSEDCLYLNVWTPDPSSTADLNVMVYIHGGGTETDVGHLYGAGLLSGSGHEDGMMPDAEIAKTGNMVFVSMNYRLGPFGFLAVNVTDPINNEKITGNYGFMDQTMALKWVNKNIKNFGGNPNKVTVFGVGAGGTSIFALLASDKTKGLFQKAWLASPSPNFDTTLEVAFKQNEDFLKELTSTSNSPCNAVIQGKMFECLQGLDANKIMNAVPMGKWANPHFRDLPISTEKPVALAIIDRTFLTHPINQVWHQGVGSFKDVEMMIGSSAQEVDDWPYLGNLNQYTWSDYESYVRKSFPKGGNGMPFNMTGRALNLYPRQISPEYQLTSMISDIRQVCGVSLMTNLIANKWRVPVYRYVTTHYTKHPLINNNTSSQSESPQDYPEYNNKQLEGEEISHIKAGFRYAYHGIDMVYFFNEVDTDRSKDDLKFSNNMRTAVFSFVKGAGGIRGWTSDPLSTNVISSQIKNFQNYKEEECNLWLDSFFLPHHTWMN